MPSNIASLRQCHGALVSAMVLAATCLGSPPHAQSQERAADSGQLEASFAAPPASARPRVWWHWMNGNITKEGIREDMEWMKRVGIGGLQNFDANLLTPQIVEQRLVYMTPQWKDAFRYAAGLADSLDLELAIASSPGWSETGGPWVKPEEGLKKRRIVHGEIDDDPHAEAALKQILSVGTSAGGARAKAAIAWNPHTNEIRAGQFDVGPGFEHWLLKFDGLGKDAVSAWPDFARQAGVSKPDTDRVRADHSLL
jgi:hypothetical protein